MKYLKLLTLIFSLLSSSFLYAFDLSNWRTPELEDHIDDWAEYNAPHTVIADFDSDGIDDMAVILLPKVKKEGFNAVALVSNNGNNKLITLQRMDDVKAQNMALELAEPSHEVYDSACSKGYWECEEGEIRKFKIQRPSIYLCYIESSCSIFMWSKLKEGFVEIPLSD